MNYGEEKILPLEKKKYNLILGNLSVIRAMCSTVICVCETQKIWFKDDLLKNILFEELDVI